MFNLPGKASISIENTILVSIIFILGYIIFLFSFQDVKVITSTVSIFLIPVVTTITLILLFFVFRHSENLDRGYRRGWFFLMLSQFFWVLGDIFWAIFATIPGKLGDINNIVLIPYALRTTFLCLAIILFPKPHFDILARLKNNVEIGMMLVTLTMIFWSFLIYPFITENPINTTNTWLLIFYTLIHFALIFATISLFLHYFGHLRKSPVSLIIISATFQVVAAMIFAFETLLNQFPSGGLEDIFWVAASVSMALAGLLQIDKSPPKVIKNISQQFTILKSTSNFSLASVMAAVGYLMILWSFYNNQSIFTLVIFGGGALVGLGILRQSLANRIINNSYKKLDSSLSEKEFLLQEVKNEVFRRKKAEKGLKESVLEYRTIFENSGTSILLFNFEGILIMANHKFEKFSGYCNDELVGKRNWKEFVFEEDLGKMVEYNRLRTTEPHKAATSYETRLVNRDGKVKNVLLNVAMLPGKKLFLASFVDITERIKAEKFVEESLKEKEILLREIHHRIKNNLQIISSLLNLQSDYVKDEETTQLLKDSQGRVRSMAMVHENLYQSPTLSDINFKLFSEKLVNDILYSYGFYEGYIKTKLDIEDIRLDLDTAIPCGLIINELVTNSVKYAFPQDNGTITVNCRSFQDELELIIADDGIGLPKDLDYKNTNTLGLQMVNQLVKQINGQIIHGNSHGTEFQIKFKKWD
jgi:two-component system, sensor histidine kinase PdtaS